MMKRKVDPSIQVSGAALSAMVGNLESYATRPVLERFGLIDVDPDIWYPATLWFDIFDEIRSRGNATSILVAIGMAVVDTAIMPPGFEDADLPTILSLWNDHYHINHKSKTDIGSVAVEQLSPNHMKVILTTLYPDDLCYGMTYAYARRTLPQGTKFVIKYDDNEKRLDEGGKRTVIHVMWN